jgi:hypothetical protein
LNIKTKNRLGQNKRREKSNKKINESNRKKLLRKKKIRENEWKTIHKSKTTRRTVTKKTKTQMYCTYIKEHERQKEKKKIGCRTKEQIEESKTMPGRKEKEKNIQFSKCTQIFQFDNTDFKLTTTGKCADSYRAQQRRLIGNDITAGWTWPDSC